jgi:hypothetical protein
MNLIELGQITADERKSFQHLCSQTAHPAASSGACSRRL